jgi:hypothetical protein
MGGLKQREALSSTVSWADGTVVKTGLKSRRSRDNLEAEAGCCNVTGSSSDCSAQLLAND